MNKALNINILIMFVIGLGLSYLSSTITTSAEGISSYNWGFIFGRATSSVLFPLAIVYFPLLFIRRGKPKFTKGTYIVWWVLFLLLSIMALMGSMLEHAS